MLEGDSGALPGGWGLYGRYSRIETDGYRDQSWSKLWSYALSAQKIAGSQSWRLNLYGGPENTHLAYLGVTPEYLAGHGHRATPTATGASTRSPTRASRTTSSSRTTSCSTPGRRAAVTLSQTLFWFDGRGYYDEQRLGDSLADYRFAPWTTSDTTLFAHDYYARDSNGNIVLDGQGRARSSASTSCAGAT